MDVPNDQALNPSDMLDDQALPPDEEHSAAPPASLQPDAAPDQPQAYFDDDDDPAILEIIRRANEARLATDPDNVEGDVKSLDAMTVMELVAAFTHRRAKHGKHSDEAMAVASRLVEVHTAAQEWAKAEPYMKARLEATKIQLGPLHVDTLAMTRQLIDLHCRQGKYRVASMTLTASAKVHESVYGDTDKVTLDIKTTLATCQLRHRKEPHALELFRSVLAVVRQLEAVDEELGYGLGPAYKLGVLSPYCECLVAVRAWDEADARLDEAVDLSRIVAGGNAPDTLRLLVRHAAVKVHRGLGADAEALYQHVLPMLSKAMGELHAETLAATTAYAELLFQRRKGSPPGPALSAVNDVYATLVNAHKAIKYGSDSSEGCFEAYSRIAEVHELLADLPAAENILRRAVHVAEQVHGTQHPATIAALFRLATVVRRQQDGKLSAARDAAQSAEVMALYRCVLAGWKVATGYGPVHPEALKVIAVIADLLYRQDDRADAVELLERGLAACERAPTLGKNCATTMFMVFETAKMYRLTVGDVFALRPPWSPLQASLSPSPCAL